MAKCTDCDCEIPAQNKMVTALVGDLCQSCRLDRVLNDLMALDPKQRAQVACEALAYEGTILNLKAGVASYGN